MLELHNFDVPTLLKALDSCQGDVYLVTREGDRLNLKSQLCQLMGLARLMENGKVAEAFLSCANPKDEAILRQCNETVK